MPTGVESKSQETDKKDNIGLFRRCQYAFIQEITRQRHNYPLKFLSVLGMTLVVLFANDSNFSRMIGIFTLYVGLAFDLAGLDFSVIENEKYFSTVALYKCWVLIVIVISIVSLVLVGCNQDFLVICRQHHTECFMAMFITALASLGSPALECVIMVAQKTQADQKTQEQE